MKRFYKDVSVKKAGESFQILLDGKPVKTPAKAALVLPTMALAKAIAAEWQAQIEEIKTEAMPLTRLSNSSIDRTRLYKDIVIDEMVNYARHDLLCYRAEGPKDLIKAETAAWDPYIKWVGENLTLKFKVTTGIETVTQDPDSMARLKAMLSLLDEFKLTALHTATTLSGSAILALALWEGLNPADKIWTASQVDEIYQAEKWGEDAEATKMAKGKHDLWLAVGEFLEHINPK